MQTESVNNSVTVRQEVTGYSMRFDDIVTSPNYYRFEIEALQVATEQTPVTITVNTDGGSLATGIEMVNEILSCKAKVTGVLRSSCHSCGSIIFLACDDHEVGISSEMLLHSGSGGSGGTPAQTVQRAESYKRQVRSLFETVYKGFLSQEEIDLMIEHDKEYIFCSEEIAQRLQDMYQYRTNVQTQAMQSMFDEQIAQEDEALEAGLQHLLKQGKATPEEIAVIKKLTPLLDEAFDKGEIDFENLGNSGDDDLSEELTITSVEGDVYGVAFEYSVEASGEVNIFNIEVCSEENAFFIDSEDLFDGYSRNDLKEIADLFSIPYVHNIGAKRLAARIEEYFVELINEYLQK